MNPDVSIGGVWLVANAGSIEVLVEVNGQWRSVIDEINDGVISHIVEPAGIKNGVVREWANG